MTAELVRLFFSREDRVAEYLVSKDIYPNHDEDIVGLRLENLSDALEQLNEALDEQHRTYDAVIDEGEEDVSDVISARKSVVQSWAVIQYALSMLAYTLDINGNEAFHRLHNGIMANEQPSMEGL